MARVKLIQERGDIADAHHALFDELAALRGRISGPSSVTLHSPGLARPWNEISEFLHRLSVVEPMHAELAVCATAREFDCEYIWAAHARQAREGGVSEQAIKATAEDAALDELPPQEALVVEYVRQLIRDRRVADDVFRRIHEVHGSGWLVELTAWIGRYAALAGILNAFEVSPAADAERLPPRKPRGEVAPLRPVRPLASAPRIAPITTREQMGQDDGQVFDAVAEGRGRVGGPFSLLLYSPPLCQRVLSLSDYLRQDAYLSSSLRELATIATARERDCPYVWAAHAPAARQAGVSDTVIEAVRDRAEPEASQVEADVIEFVRQVLRRHEVWTGLFDRMMAAHTLPGLVELTAVMGHYVFVTSILNAFEVRPAADGETLPLR